MNILVTGVAGFIGFHTAKRLILKGIKVIGVDNINNYYDTKIKKDRLKLLNKISKKNKFKFYKKDISNYNELNKIFRKNKISIVINLAAQAGVRYSLKYPETYLRSNIQGFFNIIELCKTFKIRRLIYASTSSVYGSNTESPFKEEHTADHPIQFYAASKRSNELIAHAYSSLHNLKTIGLRFFTVYGPWGRPDMALFKFVKNTINGKPINIFNYGNHARDFTYIDDIVDGIMILIKSSKIFKKKKNKKFNLSPNMSSAPFRIFNIGSAQSTSLLNYIGIIEKELNKKSKKRYLPLQKGDISKTLSNIDNLKKIGYKPKVEPRLGIKKFVKWYKDYYKK
tara:strand:+ start:212 stop:1228 length:1017 start_codon:yes stop_codon:yes gene_type:complete